MITTTSRTIEPDDATMAAFWRLETVSELVSFSHTYRHISPFTQALCLVIDSWLPSLAASGSDQFDPDLFMSRDLSACLYGKFPAIFMGTNSWATKRWLNGDEIQSKTDGFENKIREIKEQRQGNLVFVMIPEKDILIDKIIGRTASHGAIEAGMARFRAKAGDSPFIYDEFVEHIPHWATAEGYQYPDSHLLSRDYYLIFQEILKAAGLAPLKRGALQFATEVFYGDLAAKFKNHLTCHEGYVYPRSAQADHLVATGSASFETPLADTRQHFVNPNPLIDMSIEIFGDSHSSILMGRKLTYLCACVFRECTFSWNPYGVRGGAIDMSADLVVMEISQRFVL